MEMNRFTGDYRVALLGIAWAIPTIVYLWKGLAKLNAASRDSFDRAYADKKQEKLYYLQVVSQKFRSALQDFFIASVLFFPATALLDLGKGQWRWVYAGAAIIIVAALSNYLEKKYVAKIKKELGLK